MGQLHFYFNFKPPYPILDMAFHPKGLLKHTFLWIFPFTLSSTCYSQIVLLINFWIIIRERYKLNVSYTCPWKYQYKSTWEARGRGEESRVSVAASSGFDIKQTRLVVAYHPRGCPCTCPSLVSSWAHAEGCECMKSLGRAQGVPGKPGAALWAHIRSRMKCQALEHSF